MSSGRPALRIPEHCLKLRESRYICLFTVLQMSFSPGGSHTWGVGGQGDGVARAAPGRGYACMCVYALCIPVQVCTRAVHAHAGVYTHCACPYRFAHTEHAHTHLPMSHCPCSREPGPVQGCLCFPPLLSHPSLPSSGGFLSLQKTNTLAPTPRALQGFLTSSPVRL